ncbi:helix-turn-helix domain-containing protein [Streptomyces sp. SID13031]|uniref:winged helix-turn-helix transcriptional regulator n=1 Tax=Streptomyces sp. SID13031 TaxID=2706046 RepID=UPI0013C760C5|nr:helix-turn-helix domain-containing protein [Streptomyces sp. SID13031]NEA30928.1 helix-turn-helix transcriptional regulator [Streptomyces sp. SID13031]
MGSDDERIGSCELVRSTLTLIGEKWSMQVLFELRNGPVRFNELRRILTPVTQRMLSSSLRGLEHDGLVTRTVHATVPPQVEYALTEPGRALNAALQHVAHWAETHGEAVVAARANHLAVTSRAPATS